MSNFDFTGWTLLPDGATVSPKYGDMFYTTGTVNSTGQTGGVCIAFDGGTVNSTGQTGGECIAYDGGTINSTHGKRNEINTVLCDGEPVADISTGRLIAADQELLEALMWIVDNPGAHPENMVSVARSALDRVRGERK